MTDTGPWYRSLAKSSLTPPDWAFGPVWTLIYGLAVLAAVAGWRAMRSSRERAWLISLFFMNAVLNVAWSAVFFSLRRPDWALAEVATLWLSVLALIVFLWPRAQRAGALLVPYLAWVSLAAYLNVRVVQLNGRFG
jgi:tryptophan-rich sensory protein